MPVSPYLRALRMGLFTGPEPGTEKPDEPKRGALGNGGMGMKGTPPWRPTFLAALADGLSIKDAAALAGVTSSTCYNARQRDPEFAVEWRDAMQVGTELLEMEAARRAFSGWEEPVFYKGVQCGTIRRYSDGLMMFLLKGRKPEMYRESSDAGALGKSIATAAAAVELLNKMGLTADIGLDTVPKALPAPPITLPTTAMDGIPTDHVKRIETQKPKRTRKPRTPKPKALPVAATPAQIILEGGSVETTPTPVNIPDLTSIDNNTNTDVNIDTNTNTKTSTTKPRRGAIPQGQARGAELMPDGLGEQGGFDLDDYDCGGGGQGGPAPDLPGTPSGGGLGWEVGAGPPPETDQ